MIFYTFPLHKNLMIKLIEAVKYPDKKITSITKVR